MTVCGNDQGKRSQMNPVNSFGDLGELLKNKGWVYQKQTRLLWRDLWEGITRPKRSGFHGGEEGIKPEQQMNQRVIVQNLTLILFTFLFFIVVDAKKIIFHEVITSIPCHINLCWKWTFCQGRQQKWKIWFLCLSLLLMEAIPVQMSLHY